MSELVAWFRTVSAVLLLLMACAVSSAAQSSRGTLTVSLQIVPSSVLIVGEDGKTQIIEANGTNSLTVTIIGAPATFDRGFECGCDANQCIDSYHVTGAADDSLKIEVKRGRSFHHGFSHGVR
jgi:hypothetical protein